MIMLVVIGTFVVSLFASFFLTRGLIPFFERNNIIALDLQKKGKKPKLANGGGIPVFFSLMLGLMFFIAIQTFIIGITSQHVYLFASILTIFLIMSVGFFDDLNARGVVDGGVEIRRGLKQWQKPLFSVPAAIPLMVVNAGVTMMWFPLIGQVNFGLIYPLILIPIGVVGAANAINLLGGFNGSEAGMGVIYCSALGLHALMHGEAVAAAIFFSTVGALIGFLRYNWYPARILSGDSLTYCLGGVIAAGVIIGNMEKAGVIIITPFIMEFFLKMRSKFKAHCMGKVRKDGKLDPPYGRKIYSLTHLLMNLSKLTEKQVTIGLMLIQTFFAAMIFIV